MSRSQPNERIPNPCTRWHEWNGEKGTPRYYDKELKANVDLKLPFEFVLLDRLSTITGWHNNSEAGIFSNEIRDTRDEPLIVRSFKLKESIAEGLYTDIKDKVKANGGKFTLNLYIAYAEEAGTLALGSLRIHGAAMSAWFEFENDKANRSLLYTKGIRITSTLHGEKGSGKKAIEWEAPVFEFYDLEGEENEQAAAIDRDILQPYLRSYFKRTRIEQAEPEASDASGAPIHERTDHDERPTPESDEIDF